MSRLFMSCKIAEINTRSQSFSITSSKQHPIVGALFGGGNGERGGELFSLWMIKFKPVDSKVCPRSFFGEKFWKISRNSPRKMTILCFLVIRWGKQTTAPWNTNVDQFLTLILCLVSHRFTSFMITFLIDSYWICTRTYVYIYIKKSLCIQQSLTKESLAKFLNQIGQPS